MTAPVTVSNSEVMEFQKCERSHFYHFGLGLEPKVPPIRFDRGITGHRALELATKAKINGSSMQECVEIAVNEIMTRSLQFLTTVSFSDPYAAKRTDMFSELVNVVKFYIEYYWNDEIQPLLVEEVFKIPISSQVNYGMRIDVFGQYTSGPYKGDYVVDDWKFRYNFIDPKLLRLNGQLYKYVTALKLDNTIVSKGIFDQIRYRKIKDAVPSAILRRELVPTKHAVRETVMETHLSVAEDIAKRKVLPIIEQSKRARRSLTEWACKDCLFFEICETEARGEDPTRLIATEFKPTEYGYVEEESLPF